jgi:hypothetical protein
VEATPLAIISDWSVNNYPINFQPPASKVEPSISGRNKNPFNRQQGYFTKFLNGLFNSIVSTVNVTLTNVFTRIIPLSSSLIFH